LIRRRRPRFYKGEWLDILKLILKGGIVEGDHVNLFEQAFASFIGVKFAVATCTGRNGMELILDVLGIREGDEVIVPAYTLKDLVLLMGEKGIRPVLVDVDRDTFNMDPAEVEERITSRTRAIMATHIFGVPCEIEKIRKIAGRHSLKVIEDCAHAAGASFKGKKLGSSGDAAFFSFEMIKPLNTFGGGMVTTNDERLAENIRDRIGGYKASSWRVLKRVLSMCAENAVIQSPLFPPLVRVFLANKDAFTRIYHRLHRGSRSERSRYSNLQAFIGLKQLEQLGDGNARRAASAKKLTKLLRGNVHLQECPDGGERIYYFYVIRADGVKPAERIREEMVERGVDAGVGEEITDDCSLLAGYEGDHPVTRALYKKNIQLPMHDGLSGDDVRSIAKVLNERVW
jgi:perosamine synthetase